MMAQQVEAETMMDGPQSVDPDGESTEVEQESRVVPADPAASGRLPFFSISPKWQLILIGGVFIAINILVMILFVVALFLRR